MAPNISANANRALSESITIHFIHEAPTPHNNYLLDTIARLPNVILFRHFLLSPDRVPGRPWKSMGAGEAQSDRIQSGYGKYFDWRLLKLALFDRKSVFFVIGWESLSLALVLLVLGLRGRPLIMWDDGPSTDSVRLIKQFWRPRQAIKKLLIGLINRTPGTYFHTGKVKVPYILELGIQAIKLESLPFFVRLGTESLALRETHQCERPRTFILAGGRLTYQKGYDVLLSALGLVKKLKVANWKAVIIGSGPEKRKLSELSQSLALDKCVDFVDWAEPELFASYIHSCDIFVAPARLDSFPTTVIAAMQAGVAVVATDKVGSAVEFIESGRNGIITPSDQPEALASALSQLINAPEQREELAAAGRATIQEWPVERGAQLIVDAAKRAIRACVD